MRILRVSSFFLYILEKKWLTWLNEYKEGNHEKEIIYCITCSFNVFFYVKYSQCTSKRNNYYHCDEEITQEFFSNLVHQLFQKAIKHTGNGKEGDYLKWHCQGWTVKASISVNSNKGYDLNIFYDVSYLSSLEQEEKVDEEVSNLLKSLDLSNKTDYQKVKAIYDYICSKVTYDHDNLNDESIKIYSLCSFDQ